MREFDRKAGVLWTGDLETGNGLISTESQTLFQLPFSYSTRFGDETGLNSEELLAAAHAACLNMSVANTLKENGFTPVQIETTATCTMVTGDGGTQINRMRIHVRCEVPDLDEDRFHEIITQADEHCPISNLLRNALEMEITSALIQTHGA